MYLRSKYTVIWLLAPALFLFLAGAASEKKKKQEPYALLQITVVTSEGLSLPGIPVAITRQGEKKPKWRGVSDSRGEVAVRLPAGRATYRVATKSKEYEAETQEVEIYGEETVSLILKLSPKNRRSEEQ